MVVKKLDGKRYEFDEERDWIIFDKVKLLEKMKLNKEDKQTLKLIKSQLENNWRKYLIMHLNKLIKKYKAK